MTPAAQVSEIPLHSAFPVVLGPIQPEPAKTAVVKVDFLDIGQRILALPMPPRRYTNLQVGKTGVRYAIEAGGFAGVKLYPCGMTIDVFLPGSTAT